MALKQKTVYFREEDLDKWALIKNKAEWLHVMLNNSWRGKPIKDMPELFEPYEGLHTTTTKPNKAGWLHEHLMEETFEGLKDIIDDSTFVAEYGSMAPAPDGQLLDPIYKNNDIKEAAKPGKNKMSLCEHFQVKGQCMVKGCKYGRGKK